MNHHKHKPHRPSFGQALLLTSTISILSILLAPAVDAKSGPLANDKPILKSTLSVNEQKLKQLDKIVSISKDRLEERSKIVAEVKQEADIAEKAKANIVNQIEQIKAEINALDDMFVKINRYASDASGNAYADGNCTWYVKSKRPDIGNFWGNANSWYAAAQAQGWNVGTKAKVGAIATTTEGWAGHVAYVEKVSKDGQRVTISEMNWGGLYNMNTRTVPYTDFKYIYELN